MFKTMVGTTRFELAASSTPRKRSTKLSYVPNSGYYTDLFASCQGIADKNEAHPICLIRTFSILLRHLLHQAERTDLDTGLTRNLFDGASGA